MHPSIISCFGILHFSSRSNMKRRHFSLGYSEVAEQTTTGHADAERQLLSASLAVAPTCTAFAPTLQHRCRQQDRDLLDAPRISARRVADNHHPPGQVAEADHAHLAVLTARVFNLEYLAGEYPRRIPWVRFPLRATISTIAWPKAPGPSDIPRRHQRPRPTRLELLTQSSSASADTGVVGRLECPGQRSAAAMASSKRAGVNGLARMTTPSGAPLTTSASA